MHKTFYPSRPARPWWQAPPLDLTPEQASATARRLIEDGPSFNPYQLRFLGRLTRSRRPLTPYRQRVVSMLMALSRQGGWKGLAT